MASRRDFIKASAGLVAAAGGSWLANHAHGAPAVMGPAELADGTLAASIREALPRQRFADQEEPASAESRHADVVLSPPTHGGEP
jgi:hypothetical protein